MPKILDPLMRQNLERAKRAAKRLAYETIFHPGKLEDLDRYEVRFEPLSISCFGKTRAEAMESAEQAASAQLLSRRADVDFLLSSPETGRKASKS